MVNVEQIMEEITKRNEARAIIGMPPINPEHELAKIKYDLEYAEKFAGFEDYYYNSNDRKELEQELLIRYRDEKNDPEWTPYPAIGHDGWFFRMMYRILYEKYLER